MSKNLIIRNIPEELHTAIKIRAAQEQTTIGKLLIKAIYQYINTLKGMDER